MTPPIGARTDLPHHSTAAIAPLDGFEPTQPLTAAPSPIYDYAYRIVAVTAGLAMIATFL
ncbi:MAG: hypothetical protein PW789_08395 [Edaphobacter sp.]|uniref:hypothetical protein n=1 Tax=Edaphobacter sp. TaxID=1934404 RepID=UPI00239A0203|nr:hypothetical protein [Edaphobacter sp.]MDE1176614.1 hypothetical protein [Edaphobacter sp.]